MYFQVNRIATLFRVQPGSIYLLKEHAETAIFPGHSGVFNPSQVEVGCTYEVMGDLSSSDPMDVARPAPFGGYMASGFSNKAHFPIPHPPTFAAASGISLPSQKGFRKTIILVTLSPAPSSSKASKPGVTYTTVTQTQVTVNSSTCKPSVIAGMVSSTVGYDVILLDSKCYPLLDNTATTELDFWKSTRKILAAHKSSYEDITGKKFDGPHIISQGLTPAHQTSKTTGEPSLDNKEILEKVDKILSKVEKMEKGYNFITNLAKNFECVICKSTMKKPIVWSCCKHIIGCTSCVQEWARHSNNWPHCSSQSIPNIKLKGLDDVLHFASLFEPKEPRRGTTTEREIIIEDSDSDLELPPVRFRSPSSS